MLLFESKLLVVGFCGLAPFLLLPPSFVSSHSHVPDIETKWHDKQLSVILQIMDQKMVLLFKEILTGQSFNQSCTLTINSSLMSDSWEPMLTEDWLENMTQIRDNIADNLYAFPQELGIIWKLETVLTNSLEYAQALNASNSTIQICDRSKFLTCSNFTDGGAPRCACYSRNVTNCSLTTDPEAIAKNLCHIKDGSLHTVYNKEMDMCMLSRGSTCPIGISTLFCLPGLNCLTRDTFKECEWEEIAPLYANVMFKDEASGKSRRKRDAKQRRNLMRPIGSPELFCRCYPYFRCNSNLEAGCEHFQLSGVRDRTQSLLASSKIYIILSTFSALAALFLIN